ncbi:sulfotransferase domain-containing protein [Gemmatimonadota bacterium]
MLPNFLVIGAQKAASSWLAAWLGANPDIFMWRAEIHFFNARYERGISWYEHHFRHWSGQPLVGEKSPLYLSDPSSPRRIRSVLGDNVKMLASLRHPVDRAYSAYWHGIKHNRIPPQTEFPAALRLVPSLRLNSEYSRQVERYQATFRGDQLLFQILEETNQDRVAALRQCLEFLGVDPAWASAAAERRVNESKEVRRFSGPAYRISRRLNRLPAPVRGTLKTAGRAVFRAFPVERQYRILSAEVRADLMEGFRPDVARLEQLLRRDLSIWRR